MARKSPIDMTNEELATASFSLNKMVDDLKEKQSNLKFKEKFKNQPPPNLNPAFIEMQNEINQEVLRRKEKENG